MALSGIAESRARVAFVAALLSFLLAAFAVFGFLVLGWLRASDSLSLRHEMASVMNQADRLAADLELELSFIEESIDPSDPEGASRFLSDSVRWPGLVEALYAADEGLSPGSARSLIDAGPTDLSTDDPLVRALVEASAADSPDAPPSSFRLLSLLSASGTWRMQGADGGWLLMKVDDAVLSGTVLPELGERYFGRGSGFGGFVVRARDPLSGALVPLGQGAAARLPEGFWENREFSRPLISSRSRRGAAGIYAAAHDEAPRRPGASQEPRPAGSMSPAPPGEPHPPESFPIDVFRFSDPDRRRGWVIEANYRAGSFKEALRERSIPGSVLAFSFLAALYALIAGLILSSLRAAGLAARERAFVASVSHELKTPIAVVVSAADNLAADIVPAERVAQYGATLAREGRRLRDAVESILLASGVQSGSSSRGSETFRLEDALSSALSSQEEAATARRVSFRTSVEARPLVKASRALVESAIASLLSNAVRYGPPGGTVEVSLSSHERAGRRMAVIAVADSGPGIPPRERRRLFTAFWRGGAAEGSGQAGTGLGLYLARRIARMNGGDIRWKARAGGGSVFALSLREEWEA